MPWPRPSQCFNLWNKNMQKMLDKTIKQKREGEKKGENNKKWKRELP